jgi:hypothetical protein
MNSEICCAHQGAGPDPQVAVIELLGPSFGVLGPRWQRARVKEQEHFLLAVPAIQRAGDSSSRVPDISRDGDATLDHKRPAPSGTLQPRRRAPQGR